MESQDLNPELAGQAIFKEAVPIGAKPIEDMATFAMMVEYWHEQKMEHGRRLLEIPLDTTMELADANKPELNETITLDEANMKIFRIGVMAALHVFKDLPFGASVEEASEEPTAAYVEQ